MATLSIPGAQIGYDQAGTGDVVILVHAGLADRRMWDHQQADLARTHRVVRYDWRGYGGSSDLTSEVSHHDDLLAVMDGLAIPTATLVGASMGGCYALDVALAQPARVRSLCLISAVFSGFAWPQESLDQMAESTRDAVPAERVAAYRERSLTPLAADVRAMAAANVALMVAGPGRDLHQLNPVVRARALALCEDVFAREWASPAFAERQLLPPASQRLGDIAVPTLIVNGLEDIGGVQHAADLLTAGISGAHRLDLPDTGHLSPLERPVEVTAAIRALLDRRPPR